MQISKSAFSPIPTDQNSRKKIPFKICFNLIEPHQHEMQDPSISIATKMPPPASSGSSFIPPPRGSHHRRAHSEANYRLPDNLDLIYSDAQTGSFDEIGSEDDLFCTYMNMEKFDAGGDDGDMVKVLRHHRHSNSVDGSNMVDCIEAKKAMAPDKLAELWTLDPKRAKRILANRHSAARSKERKARYILELERKVQTLQTEATTLSAQLTLFQRDTMGLTNENTELKIRLQTLEQQAHLRGAVNESLKKEVERLKKATGETSSPSDNYNLGMHDILYNHSSFTLPQNYSAADDSQYIHMNQFHQLQSSMVAHNVAHSHGLPTMSQQDSLSRLQGLDINGKGPTNVKTKGPTLSASESSC